MSTSAEQPANPWSFRSRSGEEIERDIEGTRRELERTLEALHSKLSPSERIRAAGKSMRDYAERIGRSASDAVMPDITGMIRLDHTHVLALFRRFRPWTSAARKEALVSNACLALEIHAQLEEEIFYPVMRDWAGEHTVLDKSVPEHDQMRELIRVLRDLPVTDPSYDESVWKLMRVVLHHVADEESTLLPLAERFLADRLGELGREMTKRRIQLLRPHLGEVMRTSARSFPVVTAALATGLLALGWILLRRRDS